MSQTQQVQSDSVRAVHSKVAPQDVFGRTVLSNSVVVLFMNARKFLLGNSLEAKRMRAEYYPIIHPGATGRATDDAQEAEMLKVFRSDEIMPELNMAYFKGKESNTYAYTSKSKDDLDVRSVIFNRYLCEAYEEAVASKKSPMLEVLGYVLLMTSYHEFAHVYSQKGVVTPPELSYQKIVRDLTGLHDAMPLPNPEEGEEGEEGLFLEYNLVGGLIDVMYPDWHEDEVVEDDEEGEDKGEETPEAKEKARVREEREAKFANRKFKEAIGVYLRKYEKNEEKGYLDVKIFQIKLDALKRQLQSMVLDRFQPDDLVLSISYPYVSKTIVLKPVELTLDDL